MLGRIRHVIRHGVVVHTDVWARDLTQARVLVQSAVLEHRMFGTLVTYSSVQGCCSVP
jgi:hypothetical protein